jgi:hypothetical protein
MNISSKPTIISLLVVFKMQTPYSSPAIRIGKDVIADAHYVLSVGDPLKGSLVAWRVLVSYSFNKFVKVILLLLGSWASDVKGESKGNLVHGVNLP